MTIKKSFDKQLRFALINFGMGMFAFFTLQFTYWQFFPYQTAEVVEPIKVLNENKQVVKGDLLRLEISFNKESDYTPIVTRNIICSNETAFFAQSTSIGGNTRPQGQFTTIGEFGLDANVPLNTPCYFEFKNSYAVNPVRTITKDWRSETFTVVEANR